MKARNLIRTFLNLCIGLCSAVALCQPALAAENNDLLRAEILAATVVHNAAFPVSLLGLPPANVIAEGTVFAANILQKRIKAVLNVPGDRARSPNADGDCVYQFPLPQSQFIFSDLFGFVPVSSFTSGGNVFYGVPTNWGQLGTPSVFHQNSEVLITANNRHILPKTGSQVVKLPAGNHTIRWTADTLIDPIFDVAIPGALLATSIYSYMKAPSQVAAVAGDSGKAAKELSIFNKAAQKVAGLDTLTKVKAGLKVVTVAADYRTGTEVVSVTHERDQQFTVYDVHEPILVIGTPNTVLEATDLGGVLLNRIRAQIFADITASDPCDRTVVLSNDLPRLLPLGATTVTWSARDFGPIDDAGNVHTVTKTQTITIRDTQAPIMVPPPGRVLEVDPSDTDPSDGKDATGIDPAIVDLGVPMVVDLADPAPTVSSDAPDFFPVNTRTAVTWSATDHGFPSANTSSGTQLITVKELGTNTAPLVTNKSATTLTSQPVDVVLTGSDPDQIGGVFDPLGFEIVQRPEHGEFVAPLTPFFIEDYRSNHESRIPFEPVDPGDETFSESNNKVNWIFDNYCRPRRDVPLEFIYKPLFVHVTDDGTYFVLDSFFKCGASDATVPERISKWDAVGTYLGQTGFPQNNRNDSFVMDRDGFLYWITLVGSGSSTDLFLTQRPTDFTLNESRSWKFTSSSAPDIDVRNLVYARVNSANDIAFVTDKRRVFAFDLRGIDPVHLGTLKGGEAFLNPGPCNTAGSSSLGYAMDVDSEGNLYVADSCNHRVHRFTPSFFDQAGEFVMGEHVGWMGRCEASVDKSCDEDKQATRGYSCTDEMCTVGSSFAGSEPGQFDAPLYLSLDPNDILYLADYNNSRIQRFSPDGTFAGQAESTGTGINRGPNPSFVLGNMGRPRTVSVNSDHFYVVDRVEEFVHVFETTPLKEITDSSAKVTYVSNFDFHGDTDTFTYKSTDGLADSNTGTVTVRVNRNFRPPEAFADEVTTDEDVAVGIELRGDDPDGIEGVDFNGLDTLTWSIVSQPAHGTLTGSAENRTYTPDRDYFGEDKFTFRANDGVFNSPPAEVVITVKPVDDPPKVTSAGLPKRIGRGFPVILNGEYEDDGAQAHNVTVNWGDIEEVNGDFVDPDGEGGEPPVLVGIKVIEPPLRSGQGVALGQHVYTGTGPKTITYCMSDELARQTCQTKAVMVESLVNLGVVVTASQAQIQTNSTEVEVVVTNLNPEGVAGLTANQVTITQEPSDHLRVSSFVVRPPDCMAAKGRLSCALGNVAPGGTSRVVVRVNSKGSVIYDVDEPFQVNVTTTSEAIQESYPGLVSIRVLADPTDSDGDGMTDTFETVYGLNPGFAGDAALDADVDGLSNRAEFDRMTNPRAADTDGDGLSDQVEVARGLDPLRADSDFDGMPDKWELDRGLDPLDFTDAAMDPDQDGLTNLEEFVLGSDINNPDTDGDGIPDGVDPKPTEPLNPADILVPIINILMD